MVNVEKSGAGSINMKGEIKDIRTRKLLNSRGEETIEVEVDLGGVVGRFSSPSGASVGEHEAVALPDGGVEESISLIENEVKPRLLGRDAHEQFEIDSFLREIDGTGDFSRLGSNASTAISIATAKAAAKNEGMFLYEYISVLAGYTPSMPLPLGNIIEGGEHAGEGSTEIQEFLTIPVNPPTVQDAVFANALVHHEVGERLSNQISSFGGGKGDELGWVAPLTTEEALGILNKSINKISEKLGFDIKISLDVAASEMWDGSVYKYRRDKDRNTESQIEFITQLIEDYDIFYVEDPLDENDYKGFSKLTEEIGDRALICGDDLFTTNKHRIKKGMEIRAANTVLIKPNQIGTLQDTLKAIEVSKEYDCYTAVSHRSGETTDPAIAHLAVACSEIIKTGAIGGERTAKLNELIRIEENGNIPVAITGD
ncbi:enolase C-terminal domain-like protein [Methanonatronarchaeum sp. AMET-Sl]|uniref:phosphopyruvate hydratase n=1 Tax=Methanonatronarchaeum sp. AMET-Sl TaxID=3037654 RepID=UPI00244E3FBE|nr:enolase C-terminal domain-like protein [Methanonatronarchaeum sp. AMET-Sl]WGI17314.1 enolase C-terminal domain-like protein [Methanonatronarchaeum sp. AMET-Sl]